jgi:8-oxo-dGTP pyrophosphatase MutT (NUDIX family)
MPEVKKILRVEHNLAWLPKPNESQVVLSSHLPPLKLVTTAFALAFAGDRLLMTNLTRRGWEIPGGHVEPGEHPEETVRREVLEETLATLGPLHLLGYQHLRLSGPKPTSYPYPYPDSYQTFYWAPIATLSDFLPTTEAQGRAFFPPLEARTLSWVQHFRELYEAALLMATH